MERIKTRIPGANSIENMDDSDSDGNSSPMHGGGSKSSSPTNKMPTGKRLRNISHAQKRSIGSDRDIPLFKEQVEEDVELESAKSFEDQELDEDEIKIPNKSSTDE